VRMWRCLCVRGGLRDPSTDSKASTCFPLWDAGYPHACTAHPMNSSISGLGRGDAAIRIEAVTVLEAPPSFDIPARAAFRSWGINSVVLELTDALDRYAEWPRPTAIMVDGPYGVGGFPGDPPTPDGLPAWYAPHVAKWSEFALPETTLWFWGTEVSWATVHRLLETHGWEYRAAHVWDKGKGHIAGNVNG